MLDLKRRQFLTLLGGAAAGEPLATKCGRVWGPITGRFVLLPKNLVTAAAEGRIVSHPPRRANEASSKDILPLLVAHLTGD